MSRLTFPRPTQLKNVSYPTDDADAVPYGLVRDLIPVPPVPTLDYDTPHSPDVLREGLTQTATVSLNAFVQNPIPGDGITSVSITTAVARPLVGSTLGNPFSLTFSDDRTSFTFEFPADSTASRVNLSINGNAMGIVNGIQGNHAITASTHIPVSPDWFIALLDTQPTDTSNAIRVGTVTGGSSHLFNSGIPNGVIYIWWPTSQVNTAIFWPSATSIAPYQSFRIDVNGTERGRPGYAGDVTSGNHTLFQIGGMYTGSRPQNILYRG